MNVPTPMTHPNEYSSVPAETPRRAGRSRLRLAACIPLAMLAAACLGAAVLLSSCGRPDRAMTPVDQKPLRFEGVPTIRVRLTSRPIDRRTLYTTGAYRILADGRQVVQESGRLEKAVCLRQDGRWQLGLITTDARTLELIPDRGARVGVDDAMYRGTLVLLADGPDRYYVHNHVDLESYVAGVLPKELYASWHVETYRALAVAARTYAMYEMATRGQNGSFDVWDSQASQVYGGMLAETDKSWRAVRDTHGWVLAWGAPGEERIFLAQYSACNGGTVNGAHVLRPVKQIIPPLAGGQADPDGQSCPRYSWEPVQIPKARIYRALASRYDKIRALGGLRTIRVKERTEYGRAIWLEAIGPDETGVTLRAEDLRSAMLMAGVNEAKRLYSMNCELRDLGSVIEFYNGRGFGHGVGLSQWGAEDKAARGMSGEEILEFYYPGAEIFAAY